jgi:hypothetical protein
MENNNVKLKQKNAREKYEKKRHRVSLRFTSEEYFQINNAARLHETTPTTYCEIKSLSHNRKLIKEPKINLQGLAQIRKIGVNINQIAYKINATFHPITNKYVDKDLANIQDGINSIIKIFEKDSE